MSDSNNPLDELAQKVKNFQQGGSVSDPKQPIDQFVEKLIDAKGYPDLTPEVRVEVRKDLLTRLDDFIAARSIAALSDEDVLIFEKMLTEGKPEEEIQKFLIDHIDEYQNFLTNVLMEFQGVYLGRIPVPPTSNNSDDAKMPPPPPPAPLEK